jgi:hypothetical protein
LEGRHTSPNSRKGLRLFSHYLLGLGCGSVNRLDAPSLLHGSTNRAQGHHKVRRLVEETARQGKAAPVVKSVEQHQQLRCRGVLWRKAGGYYIAVNLLNPGKIIQDLAPQAL